MNINKTGYTPGSLTSTNPYNIIPSNQISMREVDYPVYGIPMNQDGTTQSMVLMQPGETYDFPDAVSVMEIPAPNMKKGGKAEWISNKIQKIMREGETKDVKQAAAIAYSKWGDKEKKQYGGMVGSLQYRQPQNYGFPYGDFAYNEASLAQPYISQPSQSPLDFNNINFRPINPVPPASAPNLGNYTPPVVDNNAYLAQQNLAAAQTIGRPQVSAANVQQYAAGLVPNVNEFMYSPEQSLQQNVQPTIEVAQNTVYETTQQPMSRQQFSNVNIFNPYGGVDIPSSAYLFGQSLRQGNTGMSILSGAKLGLGLGRNILSGSGNAKATDRAYEDYRRRLLDQSQRYTSLQEGGTVADVLTGNYITEGMGQGTVPVEVEKGEFIKTPQGQVQEVVGEKHSDGGVDLDLQPQTEVISDFTKVGATNAKYFRNEFDIKVKATDTFATVMDKYTKKIGLTDLIDEEKEVMVSIENQLQVEDPNKQTQDLNLQFLSGKIQEINTDKVPLEAMQKLAYDKIFEKQEKIPKKNTENKQEGGVITDEIVALASQYGIAPERAAELIKMQAGGTVIVNDINDPRYQAYKDSLELYNKSTATINKLKNAKYLQDMNTHDYPENHNVDPKTRERLNTAFNRLTDLNGKSPKPIKQVKRVLESDGDLNTLWSVFGDKNKSRAIAPLYKKPEQKVVYQPSSGSPVINTPESKVWIDPTPQVTAANINPAGMINQSIPISVNTIDTNQTVTPTYGQDIFQNMWRAQGKTATTAERKANPNWDADTQIMYLRPPEELGINRQNDGRYATWNDSYNNLVEGRDFMYSTPEMKNGGKVYMQEAGIVPYYTQSPFALSEYANQPFGAVNYLAGNVSDIPTAQQRLLQQAELLPNTLTRSGLLINGQPVLDNPQLIGDFQRQYNSYVNAYIANTQVNPNLTNEQKQERIQKALNENFLTQEGTVRSIDATLGNYTSSRPAFGLPYLTPEDRVKFPSLKRIGDAIDETGNIRPEYRELSPQTAQSIQNTYRMSGVDALDIGLLDIPAQADVAAVEEQIPTETAISQAGTLNTVALLPDQSPLPPSPLDPVLKANVRFERIDPVKISIEPNLIEADRQRQSVTNALGFLPDAQRASTIAQILGQTQTQTNQAISAAEAANAQAQFQADQFNIQQANREQLTRAETDLNYEARVLAGLNNTRDDIRGYYNRLQQNALGNFRYISDLNSLNAMYDNIAFTGSEYIPIGSPVNLQNTIGTNAQYTPEQQKEIAKINKEQAAKIAKILKK